MMGHRSRSAAFVVAITLGASGRAFGGDAGDRAGQILGETGVRGGLVIHAGCGEGELAAALGARDGFLVVGLDRDRAKVAAARERLVASGRYGTVTMDRLAGARLPFIDNVANLVVAEEGGGVSRQEVLRVLRPGGVAFVSRGGGWEKWVKERPAELDEWTHYLYDASNNAAAKDTAVGPPRRLQWVAGPRYSRHHDRMSSFSAAVTSGGRVFYIIDEATPVSILPPGRWALVARDAFNGVALWKRPIDSWFSQLWPLKSGPAQLPRRLVAEGERVYATLGLDAPLVALDVATGKTVRTYEGTRATEEVILSDGVLFALVNDSEEKPDYDGSERFAKGYNAPLWDGAERKIVAIRASGGEVLWAARSRVVPVTLAADRASVVFHDGESVVCLDRATGKQRWRTDPVATADPIKGFFAPTLVLHEGVVLFSGGVVAGQQTGKWDEVVKDALVAYSLDDGKKLWDAPQPPSGYRSPMDVLVVDDLVWTGETTSGRSVGRFAGRELGTGKVAREFPPDVDTYWFHHRCYRGRASGDYLLMSRTGIEFIDVKEGTWTPQHWVRGACLYGFMPGNGLIYSPQHPCACYLEAKLSGFNALAPAGAGPRVQEDVSNEPRLEKGEAIGKGEARDAAVESEGDWPTYRHDGERSGFARTEVSSELAVAWRAKVGGKLSAPVIASGRLFVSSIDAHAVHAVDAGTGKPLWRFIAGGRVDSPPTAYRGLVLFGCADGHVYALRASDGVLAWRFRAAPMDQRLISFEQIESAWPSHGSVLVVPGKDGGRDVAYCTAGRSMFLDGGVTLWRLDPASGEALGSTVLDDGADGGKGLQDYVSWLNMPTGMPDILSTNGRLLFMRSQAFGMDGERLPLEKMPTTDDPDRGAPAAKQDARFAHVFCPTGFLDDTWWHRTYWLYGSRFVSGWQGYYRSGKAAPAGRILVLGKDSAYGFGRKPEYYKWTTPIEHHLFAAPRELPPQDEVLSAIEEEKPNASPFVVKHDWTMDLPLLARAMVLANGTLFVAGPPDLIVEEKALAEIRKPETQRRILEQEAAIRGESGGLLWAISADEGKKTGEAALDSPPVFDGMAAARGRLYLSTVGGEVLCLAGRQ